jgi:tetraacyldisaccharide 4'-kinase
MREPAFWRGKTAGAAILSTLLSPLGLAYGCSVRLNEARAKPARPKARVVCIGNLTAGGTGKTPLAIALAKRLQARGANVVFLSRGYGGKTKDAVEVTAAHPAEDVGDEPLLLRAVAPTIVSRNRELGARMCDKIGADVIVMDDGHQNFQIAKDLSIVVVGGGGFGNGKLIPAGPLREPIARGLARADTVILSGGGGHALSFPGPVLRSRIVPEDGEALSGARVFAFAGIGEPDRFFDTLKALGSNIAGSRAFADHHPFTDQEIAALHLAASEKNARLITTEKDFVRLSEKQREGIAPLRIRAVFDDEDALDALLDRVYPSRNNKTHE